MRTRQKFSYHHIVHEILHLLDVLDVFISLKLIAVDVFEMYAFSWKKTFFSKNFEISEFWKVFWKKLNFQKNYQISNSSKNFVFWAMNKPKKLQRDFLTNYTFIKKKFGARALARAAHAKSHFVLKTQKSSEFGPEGRIFYRCARGSARAPEIFLPSYSS